MTQPDSTPTTDTDTPTTTRYREVVAPRLLALGIMCEVLMGVVNATIATVPIPTTVFVLVAALAIGISPHQFVDLVRGRRDRS